MLSVCVCVCVRASVCVTVCLHHRQIFSSHKHTSFYRPNQEECVCMFAVRARVCASCVHLYLPACKSGSRSIHSELNLRIINNEIDLKNEF